MAEGPEVKTKLTLDDKASAVLEDIAKSFKEVETAEGETQKGFAEFARDVAAVALGTHLPRMVSAARDMATAFTDAAIAAQESDRHMGSLIRTAQGHDWGYATGQAKEMRSELADMAVDLGHDLGDINSGFDRLVMATGSTAEGLKQANDLIGKFATVSNTIGQPTQRLVSEWASIRDGMFTANSTLGQMILKTGELPDNLTLANAQWSEMTKESRVQLLNRAMQTLSSGMASTDRTMEDVLTSFGNIKDMAIGAIGEPIVNALLPVLDELVGSIGDSREEIIAWSRSMGEDVARVAVEAARIFQEAFDFMMAHGEDIADAFTTGADAIVAAIQFILDNKVALAVILGGGAAAKIGAGAATMLGGAAKSVRVAQGVGGMAQGLAALSGGAGAAGAGVAAGGAGLGATAGAAAAAAAPLVAFVAALGAVAVAADQGVKLYQELSAESDKSDEGLSRLARQERALADVRAGNVESAYELERALRDGTEAGTKMADALVGQIEAQAAANLQLQDQIAEATGRVDADRLVEAYNQAVADGNEAMASMAADTLFASKDLQDSLVNDSTVQITGGLRAMGDRVSATAAEVERQLRDIQLEASAAAEKRLIRETEEAIRQTLKGAQVNIGGGSGGVKFEIHQDFRDQDPDRVAVVFQRDVMRAALRRVQSNRATAFGV